MEILPNTMIGSIVSEMEDAIPYFEELRIDYAINGDTTLGEACEMAGIPFEEAVQKLVQIAGRSAKTEDWGRKPMAEVIDHVLHHHHAYTRVQIEKLNGLLDEFCRESGFKYPQILLLKELFKEMSYEMRSHMSKEEDLIFPYLLQREKAETEHQILPQPALENLFFKQPLRVLQWEHRMTGAEWEQIRLLTDEYTPKNDTNPKLAELYGELKELEQDLHRHVHLESNVIFHRAIEKGWLE